MSLSRLRGWLILLSRDVVRRDAVRRRRNPFTNPFVPEGRARRRVSAAPSQRRAAGRRRRDGPVAIAASPTCAEPTRSAAAAGRRLGGRLVARSAARRSWSTTEIREYALAPLRRAGGRVAQSQRPVRRSEIEAACASSFRSTAPMANARGEGDDDAGQGKAADRQARQIRGRDDNAKKAEENRRRPRTEADDEDATPDSQEGSREKDKPEKTQTSRRPSNR